MGKRYYCDYCDRSFPDRASNRKNHLKGAQHQKQRKMHYDAFRDAATILDEEFVTKRPCKRFRQTGQCEFGSTCRFSHLTPHEIYNLQCQAEYVKRTEWEKRYAVPTVDTHSVDAFVAKISNRSKMQAEGNTSEYSKLEEKLGVRCWKIPSEIQHNVSDLPKSLLPPTLDDFLQFGSTASSWG